MSKWLRSLVVLGILLVGRPVMAQVPRYYVVDLGTLGTGQSSYPTAINNAGKVVGYALTGALDSGNNPINHAFVWDAVNGMQDLGTLGGNNSYAYDINDNGVIVGTSQNGAVNFSTMAFLYSAGAMVPLGAIDLPDGVLMSSIATGIDDAGNVVGYSNFYDVATSGPYVTDHAVRFVSSTALDLGAILPNPNDFSRALGISNGGLIVGTSGGTPVPNGSILHAALFDPLMDIQDTGHPGSIARAVNDAGQVVGLAHFDIGFGQILARAFLKSPGGTMTDLGALIGGSSSDALALNNNGQVVGKAFVFSSQHAFVWDSTHGMENLNDLIGGAFVSEATGINDQGEIVAHGFKDGMLRALLLKPIPGGPVSAPTNLTATPVSCFQIDLAWDDTSNNESRFAVERKGPGQADFTQIATVLHGVTSYSDQFLVPDTTYSYRVRALGVEQNSAYTDIVEATTLFTPPSAPTDLVALSGGSNRIDLAWTHDGLDVDYFLLERKDPDSGDFTPYTFVNAFDRTFSDYNVLPDRTYSYRLRAHNDCGFSDYSNEASATTDPIDVSALVTVTRGGFRRNPATGRYVQTITLKNKSSDTTIEGPLRLVLDNLSSNATLFNKSGMIQFGTPNPRPFLFVSVGSDGVLSPGEQVTVVLEFTNPSNGAITYTTRVLARGSFFSGGGGDVQ